MKKLLFVVALMLVGCDSAEVVHPEIVPSALQDCQFFSMQIDGSRWRIVRCPNSTTTTTSGKESAGVTVIN